MNLTVTDLERSLAFYRDVIGLHVTQRDPQSVFLAGRRPSVKYRRRRFIPSRADQRS